MPNRRRTAYDPRSRTASVGWKDVALTEREGDAFAYLFARIGRVVSRRELEREVWGMSEGTRSETVPVTMRRLRRKLTGEGQAPIQVVYGLGWRLLPAADDVERPAFDTRYLPRPTEEDAIRSLLERWPIVTLLGPAGIGKTRLAMELSPPGAVVVPVAGALTAEELVARVLVIAGVQAERMEEAQLDGRLLVLDEAEEGLEAARHLVTSHPDRRFLVTSRAPLGVPGEACFEVPALTDDLGVAFLTARVEASRWGRPQEPARLLRAVQALDGLPLALELAAAHPESLDYWSQHLERGALPTGPESQRLRAVVERSTARLDQPTRSVLEQLAVVHVPLSERQLQRWLGDVGRVRALATHSLVSWREGWSVLSTTRAVILASTDRAPLQANYDRFLLSSVHRLRDALWRDPIAACRELRALSSELISLIDRLPEDHVPAVAWLLHRFFEMHGPSAGIAAVLGAVERRLGADLLVALLRATQQGYRADLPEVGDAHEMHLRSIALTLRGAWSPRGLTAAEVQTTRDSFEDDVLRHRATYTLARVLGQTDPSEAVSLLRDHLEQVHDRPVMRVETMRWLATAIEPLDPAGDTQYARAAATLAGELGLHIVAFRAWWTHVQLRSEVDARGAVQDALEGADAIGPAAPRERDALRGLAGRLLYALGDLDRAEPLLRACASDRGRWLSAPNRAMLAAIQVERGDPAGLEVLDKLSAADGFIAGKDGAPHGERFVQVLRARAALFRAGEDREAEVARQLRAIPRDGQERAWLRLCLERLAS